MQNVPIPPPIAPHEQRAYPLTESGAAPRGQHLPSVPPMPPQGLPSGQLAHAGHAMGHAMGHEMGQRAQSQGLGLPRPEGPSIAASQYRAPGTGLWSTLAYVAVGLATLFTLGATLALLGIAWLGEWLLRRRLRMQIVGSCLRVSPDQLPELYHSAGTMAQRLGLTQLPEIYVLETNTIGAVAARLGGRTMVILTDDAIDGCLRSGDIRTLNFLVARELAHHALGHTGLLRKAIATAMPPLARLDELSADAVATAIVGDPEVAANALITMLTGPQLLPFVNRHALMHQAFEVDSAKAAKKAEQPLRQPLLMRRIARIYRPVQ